MKKQKDKYTRVLLWAYGKQDTGFTWAELKYQCSLSDLEEAWVKKIFNTTDNGDRKYVEHYRNDDKLEPNVHYYALNEKGISAALAALESQRMKRTNVIAMIIAIFGGFIGVASLFVAVWSGLLTQAGLKKTRRSLELAAKPTVSLEAQDDVYGSVRFASSTIVFNLKNTSLARYRDVSINVSIFQTYFDVAIQRLMVGPVAQYLNEGNKLFRSYSLWNMESFANKSFPLDSLAKWDFELDPRLFVENKATCPTEPQGEQIYNRKFKYFFRIDVVYRRDIDNEIYRFVKYYFIDKSGFSFDLDKSRDGFSWVIDENNDGEAIYIMPFKSENFVRYLTNNPPPYSDLPLEFFSYDPFNDKINVHPIGPREIQACLNIDVKSLKR